MGVRQVLDCQAADFSMLPDPSRPCSQPPRIDTCTHAVRVAAEEGGITAAAFTVMRICGACEPSTEKIDSVPDRPFLFAVTLPDGLPLFAGIVNEPRPFSVRLCKCFFILKRQEVLFGASRLFTGSTGRSA